MSKSYSPLAEWIYELRTEGYDMTQEQFARELGVSLNTVQRWETDGRNPSRMALTLLARMAEEKGFEPPPPVERISRPRKTRINTKAGSE